MWIGVTFFCFALIPCIISFYGGYKLGSEEIREQAKEVYKTLLKKYIEKVNFNLDIPVLDIFQEESVQEGIDLFELTIGDIYGNLLEDISEINIKKGS